MSDKTKLTVIVVIKNLITIVCFTILAIVFCKWWIVLFSALFMTGLKWKKEADNE